MINWLTFLSRISNFGERLKNFGKAILNLVIIISVIFFWFIVFTFYEPYQSTAFLMFNLIRLGIGLFIVGYIFHYLFFFIGELIYKNKMKRIKLSLRKKK